MVLNLQRLSLLFGPYIAASFRHRFVLIEW